MKINITAGNCLNALLESKYGHEKFIPFAEAMIQGSYNSRLFSEEFVEERAKTHNVSIHKYKDNLKDFFTFLSEIELYDEVVLWFGDEPFCNENTKVVLQTLKEYGYVGPVILNLVIEESGEIVKTVKYTYNRNKR